MTQEHNPNKETDHILESYYRYIGYHHANHTAESFDNLKSEAADIEYPQALDKWFEKYMDDCRKQERRIKRSSIIKKISKQIAVFLLIFGGTFTLMALSIDAVRIKSLNFIINVTERYSSIHLEDMLDKSDTSKELDNWTSYYIPAYIPENYKLMNTQIFGDIRVMYYQNPQGDELQFTQSSTSNNLLVDTEDALTENIIINQASGIIIEKEGYVTLLWHDNNSSALYIIGKVDKAEVIKMAENIKILE
jgi:hypothetical protein